MQAGRKWASLSSMLMNGHKHGAFLSYARADGEEFADRLRQRLRSDAPDIEVKQDRLLLEGGVGWWKQLQDAIDSVEFLVLVMTETSMKSLNVQKEWQYARHQGVCIYPVKAQAGIDFSQIPRWMSKAHFFDLDKEWPTFVAHLRKGCDTPRVPFMAPDLPATFIERPNEFERLKSLLLRTDKKDAVGITTAISGAGGFGKTTIASALCHDEDIIQTYDDGILWVTLGQTPSLIGALTTLYAALTGERPGFATEQDATYQLSQRLKDRACLLVIDDLWDEKYLRAFQSGDTCARLFTTRNAEIASTAKSVSVDEMREGESLALLAMGLPGLSAPAAHQLSHKLGDWPIALELARAMMRTRIDQGDTAQHAAERLLQTLSKKGPQALASGSQTIGAVVESSLELIGAEDRQRLSELSIFPEDTAIPLSIVAPYWALDDIDTEETAQRLGRLYLVRLDLGRGTMHLHDVLRGWLAISVKNPSELHAQLVNSWSDFKHLPETYAWRWLPWHLLNAGRVPDLERILMDAAWLQAKLNATDVASLVNDFSLLKLTPESQLLLGALQLSAHVLAREPSQFASQVAGRLLPHTRQTVVKGFIDSLTKVAIRPWMRSVWPSLQPPGTALLRTLTGHMKGVRSLGLSADGKRAISASWDGSVKLWAVDSGAELFTLDKVASFPIGVAITADGDIAVSTYQDGTLQVWDVTTGTATRSLTGHSGPVNGVALSCDGRLAVSASEDKTVKVWDLATGTERVTLLGHLFGVSGVGISADGRRAVSFCSSTLKVWDVEMGKELSSITPNSGPVLSVALSQDAMRGVSASRDYTLKVWNLVTGLELQVLKGHKAPVEGVALSADGRRAVSASNDLTLKLWDLETGGLVRTLVGHSDSLRGVAMSADGRCAVSASQDCTLKVWDLDATVEALPLMGHSRPVAAMALSADGPIAVSASLDSTLKVWDVGAGKELRTLSGHSDYVRDVSVSADGRLAVSASYDHTVKVWNLATGQTIHTLSGHSWHVLAVAVRPDGRRAVSASRDSTLRIWDLEQGVELRSLQGHTDAVNGVALSLDGKVAASGSNDKTVKIWDVETGEETRTLVGHSEMVTDVAISGDGKWALSASADQTIKVWDLEKGAELSALIGHADAVTGVEISPDGEWVVSASSDKTVKLWNWRTAKLLASFYCDAAAFCHCAFGKNGLIASGDDLGRVYLLEVLA